MSVGTALGVGSLVSGATSLLGSRSQASAAESAAQAGRDAAAEDVALRREIYETTRADQAPYREVGFAALEGLARSVGLDIRIGKTPPPTAPEAPSAAAAPGLPDEFTPQQRDNITRQLEAAGISSQDARNASGERLRQLMRQAGIDVSFGGAAPSTPAEAAAQGAQPEFTVTRGGPAQDPVELAIQRERELLAGFEESPDYQFVRDESMQAVERAAAAGGRNISGRAFKEFQRRGAGLASQEFGRFSARRFGRYDQLINQMASLAGIGQTASNVTAQAGQNFASGAGAAIQAGGRAAAEGFINRGNAIASGLVGASNAVSGGVENYLLYNALNSPQPVLWPGT